MDPFFSLTVYANNHLRHFKDGVPITVDKISEAHIDELANLLSHPGIYVHIGKILPKRKIIALKKKILSEVIATFKSLLPMYRLLSEGNVRTFRYGSRTIPSTEVIHESCTWGMKIAMEFERRNNRLPKDVSGRDEGCDIISKDKKGRIVRYILRLSRDVAE